MRTRTKRLLACLLIIVALAVVGLGAYVSCYYHADEDALAALTSDEVVVQQTEDGWYFDGPATDSALVFYPGAKVEETAYAPFLHALAARDMDVILVRVPFRLAFLDVNAADRVTSRYDYDHWYVGGHSLGGAMAASYASEHGDDLGGVVLLAAYATKPLDPSMTEVVLYGSNDTVLNREKVSEGRQYAPDSYVEQEISGGNHAQFGNYGPQDGDGTASISAREQQAQAVDLIHESL